MLIYAILAVHANILKVLLYICICTSVYRLFSSSLIKVESSLIYSSTKENEGQII